MGYQAMAEIKHNEIQIEKQQWYTCMIQFSAQGWRWKKCTICKEAKQKPISTLKGVHSKPSEPSKNKYP